MKANIPANSPPRRSRWHCLPYLGLAIALHAAVLAWPVAWSPHSPVPPPIAELAVVLQSPPHPAAAMAPAHAAPPTRTAVHPPHPVPTPPRQPTLVATPSPQTPPVATAAAPPLPEVPTGGSATSASHAHGSAHTPPRFDAAYLHNPAPAYPSASRRLGEEGKVLLRVRVSPEGRSVAVDIEKSSNFERLDEAARNAVQRWRFVPARHGDESVEGVVIVPIAFRLDG